MGESMNGSNVKWVAVIKSETVTNRVLAKLASAVKESGDKMQYPKFVEQLRTLTGLEHPSSATRLILIEDGVTEMPTTDKAFFFVKAQDLSAQRCYIGNVPQNHETIRAHVSETIQI